MTRDEFLKEVRGKILLRMPVDATEQDLRAVDSTAEAAWDAGLNVTDAILYARTFEEVDPSMSEEFALSMRRFLREKYAGKARVNPPEGRELQ